MAVSPYMNLFNNTVEQGLADDLTVEVIKLYGYPVWYLPRVAVREHDVFGEDVLGMYPDAIPLEVYIDNVEGFGGQGDIFSKFGVEIRDQVTFTMARRRWEEAGKIHLLEETSYPFTLETSNNVIYGPHDTLLQETDPDWTLGARPHELDLVYMPFTGKLYEIRFVEHEAPFYQFGRRMVYKLTCELYEPSSERIDTGIAEIDAVEDRNTLDILGFEFLTETDDLFVSESGGSIIMEDQKPETSDPQANNEMFQRSITNTVDFSEWNVLTGRREY